MSLRDHQAGHRSLPHTADAQVEAWAATREGCIAEAVRGSVALFLDVRDAVPHGRHAFHVEADQDEDLLVAVLDEVVYLLDTTGEVPLRATADPRDRGLDVVFQTADARALPRIGAVPKAVSLHELRFGHTETGWSCRVTWDV